MSQPADTTPFDDDDMGVLIRCAEAFERIAGGQTVTSSSKLIVGKDELKPRAMTIRDAKEIAAAMAPALRRITASHCGAPYATAAQPEPGALTLTPELRGLIALALGGGGGRVYYDDRGFNDYTTCTACHATGAGDLSDGELEHKPGCSLVAKQEAVAKLLKLAAATGAQAEALPAMRAAFRTTTLHGGAKPRFTMEFNFPTLEAMQQADSEWHAWLAAAKEDKDGR